MRWLLGILAAGCFAQQTPFIPVTGPNALKGSSFLLEDTIRGGLWLGGMTDAAKGLIYFDGSRFIQPLKAPFPNTFITGLAEDSDGGIWIATDTLGVYRAFSGQLQRVITARAREGIVEAGPDLFLVTVLWPNGRDAELVRITRKKGDWKVDTIIASMSFSRFEADSHGHIFYVCPGGYCELNAEDVANWRPGLTLLVTKHPAPPVRATDYRSSVALRDRFGCVWLRGEDVAYQCPGRPLSRPAANSGIIGPGSYTISELEDGSILIPSFAKLTIGRPGHFQVFSALNGYPGTLNTAITKDGIWLSNGNGLFVMPRRQKMEFWTERDGLSGNTFSIARTSSKTFSVAGDTLHILDANRSRWTELPLNRRFRSVLPASANTVYAVTTTDDAVRISAEGKPFGKPLTAAAITAEEIRKRYPNGEWQPCSNFIKPIGLSRDYGPQDHTCISLLMGDTQDTWHGVPGPVSNLALTQQKPGKAPMIRTVPSGGEAGITTVRFLAIDQRGWIWRGSPVGIYVATPEQAREDRWLYLNHSDGISGTDANTGSFFDDPDGSVWFGADNSVNHLYPAADLLQPREPPSIFISGYSLDNGEIQMAEMVTAVKHNSKLTAYIGSLQVDRRNALRVRYRVSPGQTAWQESRDLDLPLGNLSSGFHTLEVQGRIFTGPWSKTIRRGFNVLPPVWSTWPSVLTYLATAAIFAVSIYLLRRKRAWDERALLPDIGEWRLGALLPEGQEFLGKTLEGRFEVREILAHGGFAIVLAGYDLREHRPCALKIFRGELQAKESVLRGFEQEVAALRKIRHPSVVAIYADGFTDSGAPYLAMEFVDGQNLREVLKDGPLSPARAGLILEQLASALDAIHAHRIYHRDIKPENVILRNEQAILIDFSIAIIKDVNETMHGISRAAGTFDYMAPEQALGHAQPASDIFSLAKVAIEMLTGVRVAELLPNVALDLPKHIPDLLRAFNLGLSEESLNTLATALEFDPTKRPTTATVFAGPLIRDLRLHHHSCL